MDVLEIGVDQDMYSDIMEEECQAVLDLPEKLPGKSPGQQECTGQSTGQEGMAHNQNDHQCMVRGCEQRKYGNADNFRRHWHDQHVARLNKFLCALCNYKCKRPGNVLRHIKTTHHLDRTKVDAPLVLMSDDEEHNSEYVNPGDVNPPQGYKEWAKRHLEGYLQARKLDATTHGQLDKLRATVIPNSRARRPFGTLQTSAPVQSGVRLTRGPSASAVSQPAQRPRVEKSVTGCPKETLSPAASPPGQGRTTEHTAEDRRWIGKLKLWREEAERLKRVGAVVRQEKEELQRQLDVAHSQLATNRETLAATRQMCKDLEQQVRQLTAQRQCVCRLPSPEPAWAIGSHDESTQTQVV